MIPLREAKFSRGSRWRMLNLNTFNELHNFKEVERRQLELIPSQGSDLRRKVLTIDFGL